MVICDTLRIENNVTTLSSRDDFAIATDTELRPDESIARIKVTGAVGRTGGERLQSLTGT